MKNNVIIIKISSAITFVSFIIALLLEWRVDIFTMNLLSGHRNFFIDILLGIFAGAILSALISIITYLVIKEKIKVKIEYALNQLHHKIKTFELHLRYVMEDIKNDVKNAKETKINTNKDIVLKTYDYIGELGLIFFDLSLEEAKAICGSELFYLITNVKKQAEDLACNLYNCENLDKVISFSIIKKYYNESIEPLKTLMNLIEKHKYTKPDKEDK